MATLRASCLLAFLCFSVLLFAVAAQSQIAGTTTCTDNEADRCFGENNNAFSPTGFDTGEMSACPMTTPTSPPIPVDADTDCSDGGCSYLEDECSDAEDSFCYLELDATGIDEIPSLGVRLRIWFPPEGVLRRGTVVLGTAAAGISFFTDSIAIDNECDLYGVSFALRLAAIGFVVIDRAWDAGWPQ